MRAQRIMCDPATRNFTKSPSYINGSISHSTTSPRYPSGRNTVFFSLLLSLILSLANAGMFPPGVVSSFRLMIDVRRSAPRPLPRQALFNHSSTIAGISYLTDRPGTSNSRPLIPFPQFCSRRIFVRLSVCPNIVHGMSPRYACSGVLFALFSLFIVRCVE